MALETLCRHLGLLTPAEVATGREVPTFVFLKGTWIKSNGDIDERDTH